MTHFTLISSDMAVVSLALKDGEDTKARILTAEGQHSTNTFGLCIILAYINEN